MLFWITCTNYHTTSNLVSELPTSVNFKIKLYRHSTIYRLKHNLHPPPPPPPKKLPILCPIVHGVELVFLQQ